VARVGLKSWVLLPHLRGRRERARSSGASVRRVRPLEGLGPLGACMAGIAAVVHQNVSDQHAFRLCACLQTDNRFIVERRLLAYRKLTAEYECCSGSEIKLWGKRRDVFSPGSTSEQGPKLGSPITLIRSSPSFECSTQSTWLEGWWQGAVDLIIADAGRGGADLVAAAEARLQLAAPHHAGVLG